MLGADELLHCLGDFVVKYVLLGSDAGLIESVYECLICPNHFSIFATFHGFNKDAAAIYFNHYHDVLVAHTVIVSGIVPFGWSIWFRGRHTLWCKCPVPSCL